MAVAFISDGFCVHYISIQLFSCRMYNQQNINTNNQQYVYQAFKKRIIKIRRVIVWIKMNALWNVTMRCK